MSIFKKISLCLLTLMTFFSYAEDEKEIPQRPVETTFNSFTENGKVIYSLSYKNAPHWHTYWKNPGDAGLPTKIEVLNENLDIEEKQWPVPTRYLEEGDILAYGYSGEYSRYFTLKGDIPEELKIKSTWLVCRHICIPGKIEFTAKLDSEGHVLTSQANDFSVSKEELLKRYHALPQKESWPQSLDLILKKGKKDLEIELYYNLTNQGAKPLFHPLGLLTPQRVDFLDIRREKLYQNKAGTYFAKIDIGWDGEYSEPEIPFPTDGSFEKPIIMTFLFQNPQTQTFSIIEKEFDGFDIMPGTAIDSLMDTMSFIDPNKGAQAPKQLEQLQKDKNTEVPHTQTQESSSSLIGIIFFAFIGGLILNIMPCVLPVISLKLFGLVSHSNESRKNIFKHNIFYTLGVLATFFLLAVAILVLKATGENVGWGFQLQSPVFVSIMIIFLFTFALNLFGLYEFKTPGGKSLGNIETKKGFFGDFIGGVLATILSTPCSAPFLGTALTFAFSSSPITIIMIFQAIGLGLAFPFLITGIFPATVKFLPRPGMWMEHVKKFLGLTLILTALWLTDVFLALTNGNTPFLFLLSGLIFLFFAFYAQKNIAKKKVWVIIYFLIPFLFLGKLYFSSMLTTQPGATTGQGLLNEKNINSELKWEKWSEETMLKYADQGVPLFIDFTAKWCFTCKVNEKLVIDTSAFKNLVSKKGVKLLLADWTKYDPVIGEYLKKNGHVGVPAYFIQTKEGELIKLGETISISEIEKNL